MSVCALVSSELIDQHAGVVVVVNRALASADSTTRRRNRAIRLRRVLQCAGLRVKTSRQPHAGQDAIIATDLVVPRTCPARVSALVAGVDVDQDAATVPGQVRGARAVPAAAVARKRDVLAGAVALRRGKGPPPRHAWEVEGSDGEGWECRERGLEQHGPWLCRGGCDTGWCLRALCALSYVLPGFRRDCGEPERAWQPEDV